MRNRRVDPQCNYIQIKFQGMSNIINAIRVVLIIPWNYSEFDISSALEVMTEDWHILLLNHEQVLCLKGGKGVEVKGFGDNSNVPQQTCCLGFIYSCLLYWSIFYEPCPLLRLRCTYEATGPVTTFINLSIDILAQDILLELPRKKIMYLIQ